ncbi:hypothetical protein DFH29DRAFT_891147 [Suillus ampliporus]|nr:hypothetical protein DFH29DRAFT_891147 [Suillus ampliporus]
MSRRVPRTYFILHTQSLLHVFFSFTVLMTTSFYCSSFGIDSPHSFNRNLEFTLFSTYGPLSDSVVVSVLQLIAVLILCFESYLEREIGM